MKGQVEDDSIPLDYFSVIILRDSYGKIDLIYTGSILSSNVLEMTKETFEPFMH